MNLTIFRQPSGILRKLLWKMLILTLNSCTCAQKKQNSWGKKCLPNHGERRSRRKPQRGDAQPLRPPSRHATHRSPLFPFIARPLSFPTCLPERCLSIFGLPALFPLVFVLSGSTTDTAASTSTSPCASRAICASSRGTINKSLKVSSKSFAALNTGQKAAMVSFWNFLLWSGFAQSQGYHRLPADCGSQTSAKLHTRVTNTTTPVTNPGEGMWHLTRWFWATWWGEARLLLRSKVQDIL